MSNIRISALTQQDMSATQYEWLLCSLGYETRSRYIASRLRDRCMGVVAIGFHEQNVLAYASNRRWCEEHGVEVIPQPPDDLGHWWTTRLAATYEDERPLLRIAVDISSMPRARIASVVSSLGDLLSSNACEVDFLYALARYSPPAAQRVANRAIEPIHPKFAGWTVDPAVPPVLICGLGYEEDQAMGALEYLEAGHVWAWTPRGDVRYERAIQRANVSLLSRLSREQCVSYAPDRPFRTIEHLESQTYGLLRSDRVVVIPCGPKVFALCSLLVACVHPEIAIWRVSASSNRRPSDRVPSGQIVGVRVRFDWGLAQTSPLSRA